MSSIVTIFGGQAVTTSVVIAEGVDHEHRAVLKLLRDHLSDFEDFGRVAFEVQPFETAGGTQQREVAILNEHQATLLISFMRNIGPVKEFKKRLVKAFWDMARQQKEEVTAVDPLRALHQMIGAQLEQQERAAKLEREQARLTAQVERQALEVQDLMDEVRSVRQVFDECPAGHLPIGRLEERASQELGIPAWVSSMVVRNSPLGLVPVQVRNQHAAARGSVYLAYPWANARRVLEQFRRECTPCERRGMFVHPFVGDGHRSFVLLSRPAQRG